MVSSRKVVEYVFFACLSAIGTAGVSYVQQISETMIILTKSVTELNLKIEILTQKMVSASQSLEDHEERIRRIELKNRK